MEFLLILLVLFLLLFLLLGRQEQRERAPQIMTEAQWRECTDPELMLRFLGSQVTERKLRLFAVACCRLIIHLMTVERSRHAVEVAERLADGLANQDEQQVTVKAAKEAGSDFAALAALYAVQESFQSNRRDIDSISLDVAYLAGDTSAAAAEAVATYKISKKKQLGPWWHYLLKRWRKDWRTIRGEEKSGHAALVREIFGDPFHNVALDKAWLTSPVMALAQSIYDNNQFDRLPFLVRALEEAGCGNEDILAHCRSAGSHVRGCWVVDLLLKKE